MAWRRVRWGGRAAATVVLAALLAGCIGGAEAPRVRGEAAAPRAEAMPQADAATPGRIGAGSVKIALVVPMTGPGANVGAALRSAAELAYEDFQRPDLEILVKDDRGTPEGAREAAQAALDEGAEIVLGPLFAANVQAVAGVARPLNRPVVAFSTDVGVAARGVYLISFLPQSEVDRVVDEAVAAGRRSFAALVPDNGYGNAVEAQFREAVARKGARLVGLERYPPGQPGPAVERLRGLVGGNGAQADALFLPDTPDGLPTVAAALTAAGFSPTRVKPLGTAVWNDPRVFGLPALQGGWFAAAGSTGFAAFAQRYQARFGAPPPRAASLGYDAVSLVATLVRQYGTQRFAEATLTAPSGFSGLDGTFRFRPDGPSERALAVYEIRSGAVSVVSPAPRSLGPSGT